MSKDAVRTTESDHEHWTSFLLGTMSLKAAGCSVDPVVVMARCWVVMCILHCCMALGRMQMAQIERLANDRLARGDQVTRAAIEATLHENRTGCRLGKDAPPDGVETSRLFAAWAALAFLLVVVPDEPLYKAVVDMAQLLRDLYHTCGSTTPVPGFSSCLLQALCTRVCVLLPPFFGGGCRPRIGGHMGFWHANVLTRLC